MERDTVALAAGAHMHVLKVDGAEPTWILLPGLGKPSGLDIQRHIIASQLGVLR
jgi:hypothetical protein